MSTALHDFTAEQDRRRRAERHVEAIVEKIVSAEPSVEFGEREGPCIVEYRDWWHRGWPMYRGFSCLGCKHHERDPEYRENYCVHPAFLEAYDSKQSVANGSWWRREMAQVHAFSCPVLRMAGVEGHCPSLPRQEIAGKQPSKAYRTEEAAAIFSIPQRVPYYVADAYARGERVDKQHPTY